MKFRSDFVTNSSSSSFILDKRLLTKTQINLIHDHINVAEKYGEQWGSHAGNAWNVEDYGGDTIKVSTYMDNFSMSEFFREIRVKKRAIIG